jgi:Leucine-rich repeat (LRR) protein
MKNLLPNNARFHSFTRIFVLITVLIVSSSIWAQKESSSNPREKAKAFFAAQDQLKSATETDVYQIYQSTSSASHPFYIFRSEQEGFVMLVENAGDYIVAGYSSDGDIKPGIMPEGLTAMIDSYEKAGLEPSSELKSLKNATVIVDPLLDQKGIGLNQYAHSEAGGCPTGCVATAFTQLIAYNEYPPQGIGAHCYTHPKYGQLCADFENTTYNWGSMTDDDYKNLSFQVAVAMDMNFCGSPFGSFPGRTNFKDIMQDHFGLFAFPIITDSYYITNELDNQRPVYSLLPGDPGHAVIIDGYDSDGYFHLNFGWDGYYNGFFLLNTSQTFFVGSESAGYTFGTNISSSYYISREPMYVSEQDSLALVALHNSLNGTTGWNLSEPVCLWDGVVVYNKRVKEIRLTAFIPTLVGTLPADLGNLDELITLSIQGEKIDGTIPEQIFNLSNLQELIIERGSGNLTSTIPSGIGNLTHLEHLSLPKIVEGTLPSEIGNLTNLEFLDLSKGNLSGNLPPEMSNLINLRHLDISDNQISGSLPVAIGNLTKVVTLNLSDNSLSGNIPETIGNMHELEYLWLNNNDFDGEFPATIGNCTKIKDLRLNSNQYSGDIPDGIGNMTSLNYLDVRDNHFTSLPNAIGNLTSLISLDLGKNNLPALPDSITNLKALKIFRADSNQISYIPQHLGSWPDLTTIDLSNNRIEIFPEALGYLTRLSEVNFENNNIQELPASVSQLRSSANVNLSNNQIKNSIPEQCISGESDVFNLTHNFFTYADIPVSDKLNKTLTPQKNIPVTKRVFKGNIGDTIKIDIRDIARLSAAGNKYFWFEYPDAIGAEYYEEMTGETENPTLTIVLNEQTLTEKYYCKVFNPNAPTYTFYWEGSTYINPVLRYLNTDTISFALLTQDDVLNEKYPDKHIISSGDIKNGETTNHEVTLVSPFKIRGNITWQGSADGQSWVDLSTSMEQNDLAANIGSISSEALVLSPQTPAFYRCKLTEGTCDPIISDTIKVNPLGEVLFDETVNVATESRTVAVDSIEVTIPAGLSGSDFRMVITKLDNPPEAPDGVRMGTVYDVTLSLGTLFDHPLHIKLKNITPDLSKLSDYKGVWFDEEQQTWVPYQTGGINMQDKTVEFYTSHLTKIAWWELEGSYTHYFRSGNVEVLYKYGVGNEDFFYNFYEETINDYPAVSWRTSNTDPEAGGNPVLVQDIAGYLNQVITKLDTEGLVSAPTLFYFRVYLSLNDKPALGHIGVGGYALGHINLNVQYASDPAVVMSTLAHEYMHYAQSKYIPVLLDNYFFAETHAPLADRIVWNDTQLKQAEPLSHLKEALNTTKTKTIYDLLGNSWDAATSIIILEKLTASPEESNTSGAFLHFLRSLRNGTKLDPVKVLKDTWSLSGITNQTWRTYMDSQIQEQLESTIGDEFDNYVRYLLEGSNDNFTILNQNGDNPFTNIIKNAGSDNNGTFTLQHIYSFDEDNSTPQEQTVSINIPYLAAKVMMLSNNTVHSPIVVNYTRNHKPNENIKVYYSRYDFNEQKMIFKDISDSTKYSLLISEKSEKAVREHQNTAMLLFVNKNCPAMLSTDRSFTAGFELHAMPVPNINDLAYANVTTNSIHSYSNGETSYFIVPGRMSMSHIDASQFFDFPDSYSREKTMFNDSTYRVEVAFRDSLVLDNGPLVPTSIVVNAIHQTIDYNFFSGELTVIQHTYKVGRDGEYTNPVTQDFRSGYIHTITDETHTMKLKNVFIFNPSDYDPLTGKTIEFTTSSTEETQNTIEKLDRTFTTTYYNNQGEVTGSTNGSYVSTDYSGTVTLILMFHNQ